MLTYVRLINGSSLRLVRLATLGHPLFIHCPQFIEHTKLKCYADGVFPNICTYFGRCTLVLECSRASNQHCELYTLNRAHVHHEPSLETVPRLIIPVPSRPLGGCCSFTCVELPDVGCGTTASLVKKLPSPAQRPLYSTRVVYEGHSLSIKPPAGRESVQLHTSRYEGGYRLGIPPIYRTQLGLFVRASPCSCRMLFTFRGYILRAQPRNLAPDPCCKNWEP